MRAERAPRATNSRGLSTWVWEGLLLTFAALLLAFFVTVPLPVDPMIYLEAAINPRDAQLNHWTTRLGLVLPIWLVSRVFGYSEFTLYAVPIAATLLLTMATAMVGRNLYGRGAGIAAACIVICGPFVLPFGSQLLPDVGSAAFVTLAFGWLARAANKPADTRSRDAVITGLSFAAGYLFRETALVFLPSLVLFAGLLGFRWRHFRLILGAALLVTVLESLVGLLLWGDPFARLHGAMTRSAMPGDPTLESVAAVAASLQSNPLTSAFVYINILRGSPYGQALMWMGIFLVLLAGMRRSRVALAVIGWIALPWVLFALMGSLKPGSGRPLIRLALDRYWVGLVPPIALGALGVLTVEIKRIGRRRLRQAGFFALAMMTASICVLGITSSIANRGAWFVRLGNDAYWQLRNTISSLPVGTEILVDSEAEPVIELYTYDSIGRRVFDGALVPSSDATRNPAWVLVDYVTSSPPQTIGPTNNPPLEYAVFNAADNAEWVLLTREKSAGYPRNSLYRVDRMSPSPYKWSVRRVVGSTWSTARPLEPGPMELAAGERLVIFEDSGPYRTLPPESLPSVPSGALLELRLSIVLQDVRVTITCDYFPLDGGGSRYSIRASSLVPASTLGGELVSFCRTPDVAKRQFQVRPLIVIEGPGLVEVHGLLLSLVGSSHFDGR